jgi:hypothetical protein
MIVADILVAYLGYRRWGGWRGALYGLLILWAIYLVLIVPLLVSLLFLGPQVELILSEVGDSI